MNDTKEMKHIVLKNGYHYSGIIILEDEKTITLQDKYDQTIILYKDGVMLIEPWKPKEERDDS